MAAATVAGFVIARSQTKQTALAKATRFLLISIDGDALTG